MATLSMMPTRRLNAQFAQIPRMPKNSKGGTFERRADRCQR